MINNDKVFAIDFGKENITIIEREEALDIINLKTIKKSIMDCLVEISDDEIAEKAMKEHEVGVLKLLNLSSEFSTILEKIENTECFNIKNCNELVELVEELTSDLKEFTKGTNITGPICKIPVSYLSQLGVLSHRLNTIIKIITNNSH